MRSAEYNTPAAFLCAAVTLTMFALRVPDAIL